MSDIKKLAAFMSLPANFQYVTGSPNEAIRRQRINELKNKFLSGNPSGNLSGNRSGNFSTAANFSAACDEGGNPEAIPDADWDFATFNQKAREVTAFESIKRIVAVSNVRDNAKQYALQRNEIVKRNKAKKAEQDKQKKSKFVSHPNFY